MTVFSFSKKSNIIKIIKIDILLDFLKRKCDYMNNISIILILISLIYSIFLNFFFFSKKHIRTYENKIFSILVIINFFGLLLELLCYISVITTGFGISPILTTIINKMFLIYLLLFAFIFSLYLIFVCFMNVKQIEDNMTLKRLRDIIIFIFIISCLLIIILPVKIKLEKNYSYSYGYAPNVVYIASLISFLHFLLGT